MKEKPFEKQSSRRIWSDEGVLYFCNICLKYLPEDNFYNRKDSKWGKESRCKLHFTRKSKDEDKDLEYIKLNPLKESDVKETREVLERMGYDLNSDEPVHVQFLKRKGLWKG